MFDTKKNFFINSQAAQESGNFVFGETRCPFIPFFLGGGGGREDRRGLNPKVRGSEPGKAKKNLVAPLRSFVSKNVSK